MDKLPELHPPRVIIRPDGNAPVTVPDDLREEWHGRVIPTEQEYVRADIFNRACEIIERLLEGYGTEQLHFEEWKEGNGEAEAFLHTHWKAEV